MTARKCPLRTKQFLRSFVLRDQKIMVDQSALFIKLYHRPLDLRIVE